MTEVLEQIQQAESPTARKVVIFDSHDATDEVTILPVELAAGIRSEPITVDPARAFDTSRVLKANRPPRVGQNPSLTRRLDMLREELATMQQT